MPAIGGFFGNQWGSDFGQIASRVAETLGNVRATSQSAQQRAATEAAKRQQPTRQITIVENGDGTVTHTTTVKNAPQQPPQQEVAQAANEPLAQYYQSLTDRIQNVIGQMPEPTDIDETQMATKKGREQLLKDAGYEIGGQPGDSLYTLLGRLDQRDELLANPQRVRQMVMAARLKRIIDTAKEAEPFSHDLTSLRVQDRADKTQQRLLDSEQRRQDAEAERERHNRVVEGRQAEETFLGDFTRGDHNYGFMDEKAMNSLIDAEKQRYKARFGSDKEMPPWMESLMRSRIADDQAKQRRTEALDAARQANQDRTYERLLSGGNRRPRKLPESSGTESIIGAIGDEEVDQSALLRTGNSRLSRNLAETRKNVDKAKLLDARIAAAKRIRDDATAAQLQIQRDALANRNIVLNQENARLLKAGFGGRGQSGKRIGVTPAAPAAVAPPKVIQFRRDASGKLVPAGAQ